MSRIQWLLIVMAFALGAGLTRMGAQQKPAPGGFIVERDAEIAKNEHGTHNGGGLTIGYSVF